jgi:hypothetical protein
MKGRTRWRFIKLKNHIYFGNIETETGMLTIAVFLSNQKYIFHLAREKLCK